MLLRVRDLGDRHAVLDRRLQVDVVGADAGGQRELQLRRLGDPLGGQVGGPERLGDHDIGVGELALEDRVRAVLVGGDDQLVPGSLEELAQPQLAGDAAEQLAGPEAERLRGRRALAVVVALDLRDIVARIGRRVAVDRVVVEHAENVRHGWVLPRWLTARPAWRRRTTSEPIMRQRARERATRT